MMHSLFTCQFPAFWDSHCCATYHHEWVADRWTGARRSRRRPDHRSLSASVAARQWQCRCAGRRGADGLGCDDGVGLHGGGRSSLELLHVRYPGGCLAQQSLPVSGAVLRCASIAGC